MRKNQVRGIDARVCKQANIRIFNDTLNKVMKELPNMTMEEIFTVEFRGYKFNALPFLLNGSSYYDAQCFGWLMQLIAREFPVSKEVSISELYRDKFLNAKVFDALMPGDRGRRELFALYFMKNPTQAARLLFQCASRVLNIIVLGESYGHINYQCPDLCNTQAFSVYLAVYWIANMTPALRNQIDPNLRKINFIETIEKLCPENSLHFKYIKGAKSVDGLVREYRAENFEDGSSIAIREAYSNVCKGNWDGSPMTAAQLAIGTEESTEVFFNPEGFMNMHLARCYLYGGIFEKLQRDLESSRASEQRILEESDKVRQKYNRSSEECTRLRTQNQELQTQVSQLRSENAKHVTNDSLLKRISELEAELKSAKAENDQLFAERLELKQELSSRAKSIKRLSARIKEQGEDVEEEVAEVSHDEMIAALKDKRIIIVGGDRSKSMMRTLQDWGLKSVRNMSGNVQKAECDFLVICTILCGHADVYQAERYVRGQDTDVVYVNGVNAELILRSVYDAHILRSE